MAVYCCQGPDEVTPFIPEQLPGPAPEAVVNVESIHQLQPGGLVFTWAAGSSLMLGIAGLESQYGTLVAGTIRFNICHTTSTDTNLLYPAAVEAPPAAAALAPPPASASNGSPPVAAPSSSSSGGGGGSSSSQKSSSTGMVAGIAGGIAAAMAVAAGLGIFVLRRKRRRWQQLKDQRLLEAEAAAKAEADSGKEHDGHSTPRNSSGASAAGRHAQFAAAGMPIGGAWKGRAANGPLMEVVVPGAAGRQLCGATPSGAGQRV